MVSLYWFPMMITILVPLCCVVPYLMAVYYKHVTPFLPYISDSGGTTPESSLFSQLMDLTSIMISFTVYIRFVQIQVEYLGGESPKIAQPKAKRIELYNKICHYFGHLLAVGGVIIGNYRMTELLFGHATGVFVAFSSALIYQSLMAYIMFQISSNKTETFLAKCCSIVAIVSTLSCGLSLLFALLSHVYGEDFFDNQIRLHWSSQQNGYVYHCLSALFEWIAVLTLVPYFATFVILLRHTNWASLKQPNKPNVISMLDSNANQSA